MKKIFILLIVMFICSDLIQAQYTPPSGYTSFYRLRMWTQGAKAGADSLNQNWKDIDSIMYNLVVNVDPRYFKWKDANHDTLTLNLQSFGTIGFADGENLFLPFHASPYTLLGTNAIATTTGGYVVFKWSSRIDTMMSYYQYRSYKNGTESIGGNKTYNGTMTYNNTSTFNVVPSNLFYFRTLFDTFQAASTGTVTSITPVNRDSIYVLNGIPNTEVTYNIASGVFIKHSTDQALIAKTYAHLQGSNSEYDLVTFELTVQPLDSLGVHDSDDYLGTGIDTTVTYRTNTLSNLYQFSDNIPIRWTVYARVKVKSGATPPYAVIFKGVEVVLKSKFTNGW